ncbi:MAG: 1-(5-phosphoribosyl)-5-[(5-phosphoribosylamino)methylideneamino]imidazole-4-carboxamide isomerase [Candidatus Dormibacteraeota bacterium]|nr:1-(5-phosphoribosyl)-5-[(5-phosphoribosylamino)methylideneamino]imidazole-4-carboxamide isomerase [Candidatus Dormibacteraeota bacterium]
MLVIPSIDILGGRTVRLFQGDYAQVTAYDADPVEVARGFAREGARRIHVVDLDAARGDGQNPDIVNAVIAAVDVEVEVGGGVRGPEAVERLLAAGAAFVVVGTVAAERPGDVVAWVGRWPGRIHVGLDARDGVVAIHGWEKAAGRTVLEMIELYRDAPVAGFIYTEISRDGALQGAATEDLADLVSRTDHPVILSGGITTVDDLSAAAAAGAAGAIVGRAIYEGRLTVADAVSAGDRAGRGAG